MYLGMLEFVFVGHIQTGHTDLPPPQVYGRLLQGFQFGVCTFHGDGVLGKGFGGGRLEEGVWVSGY